MAKSKTTTSANLGFEDKLWAAADKLRGNMDAAEYKHVVLGLIFLKYISDAFMEKFSALQADKLADPEDKDEYLADNIFWVPPEARWSYLQKNAKRPEIGTLVDDALTAIERDNKVLKGVLPKDYARPALDKARLGEIIDLIATIGLGDKRARERDVLGRVALMNLAIRGIDAKIEWADSFLDDKHKDLKADYILAKDMGRYPLALPPEPLAKAFQDHVAALHQRIGLAVRQNRRLAGLRDTLLPKLLSGEIELPEAEAIAEEVVP